MSSDRTYRARLNHRRLTRAGSLKILQDAIDALNSLQSNAAVLESIRAAGIRQGKEVVDETVDYLTRLGYKPSDLNPLNAIHITGTKGKGSTSAFCSSLLTTLAPDAKVGLYTSPHLVAVRERIRINGAPVSEETFAKHFWEVWDRFGEAAAARADGARPPRPAYFRFLTFVAYHLFLSERVDATILEVGVGGTVDSTNLVPSPLVTGVSALGLDHVQVLGRTIAEIACNKGGIFKTGVPALTVEQPEDGLRALQARAQELETSSFNVVPEHPKMSEIKLGLAGIHQRSNASLALALVATFLASPRLPPAFSARASDTRDTLASPSPSPSLPPVPSDPSSLVPPPPSPPLPALPYDLVCPSRIDPIFITALQRAKWPGRCQLVHDRVFPGLRWALDGAHTVESLRCCGTWWRDSLLSRAASPRTRTPSEDREAAPLPKSRKVLVFNCTSGRNARELLGSLVHAIKGDEEGREKEETAAPFDEVVFCTNVTYSTGVSKGDLTSHATFAKELQALSVQHELATAWQDLTRTPDRLVHVVPSIEDAVEVARAGGGGGGGEEGGEVDVLVAGSLHLVGGVMEVAGLEHAL